MTTATIQDLPPYGTTNAEHYAWELAREARDAGKSMEQLIQDLKDEQDPEGWAEVDAAFGAAGLASAFDGMLSGSQQDLLGAGWTLSELGKPGGAK